MKTFEQKTETTTTTKKVLTAITCDLCKKEFADEDWDVPDGRDDSTTVLLRTAEYRYDCGDATEYEFDICPSCFLQRLIPLLKEAGAEPRVTETWW